MELIKFLIFLFIYIPLNVVFMLLAAFCFSILNKAFSLHFPVWAIGLAAGILVFALLVSMVESSSTQVDTGLYYTATAIINTIVIICMLTFSGISKLVIKKDPNATAFSFGKAQKLATVVYFVAIGATVALPLLAQTKDYLQDVNTEKHKTRLKNIIDKNDTTAFKKALNENYDLAELRLDYTTQSLLEYLLVQDKTELVNMLINNNKGLLRYNIDWEINSPAMATTLINGSMTAVEMIEKLTYKNNSALVKMVVEKYKPTFNDGNVLLVQYIVRNTLDYNKNIGLFNYLADHGLANHPDHSSEAINYFVKKNDIDAVKLLDEKGFTTDTSRRELMETAIANENIEMIYFLFDHKFSLKRPFNEYTYVEYAITSNAVTVIDILLKFNPDVTTLHPTYDEESINALQLAQKHNQTEMLQKLKAYSRS